MNSTLVLPLTQSRLRRPGSGGIPCPDACACVAGEGTLPTTGGRRERGLTGLVGCTAQGRPRRAAPCPLLA